MATNPNETRSTDSGVAGVLPLEGEGRPALSTALVGLLFAGLAMLYSLVLWRYQAAWQHGSHTGAWYQPLDIWNVVNGGRYVWHGALGYVYSNTYGSYSLPLSYILTAPIAAIVDHFHWAEPYFGIARPSAWPLVGGFSLVFDFFLLDAVRRLGHQLGLGRRTWGVQIAAVFVVLVPAFQYGHFEDVLALTFVLHACRYLLAGRPIHAALLLSLAVSSKQWALLLIPFAVLLAPPGLRIRSLLAACALPLLLVAVVMSADPSAGYQALFSPISPSNKDVGHTSFFLTWFGAGTSRVTRTLAVLASPLIAWRFRAARRPEAVLAVMSVILLVRPLLEPSNYAYYWTPALLLAGMVGVAAHHTFRWRDWVWQIGAILWALPHGNPATDTFWWLVEVALLTAIWLQVTVNCGVRVPMRLHRILPTSLALSWPGRPKPGRLASQDR